MCVMLASVQLVLCSLLQLKKVICGAEEDPDKWAGEPVFWLK